MAAHEEPAPARPDDLMFQWRCALRDAPGPGKPGGITAGQQHLGLVLATFMNRTGECWPSMETLARAARLSVQSVRRHSEQLKTAGLLEVFASGAEIRGGRLPGGGYRSTRYRAVIPSEPVSPGTVTKRNGSTKTTEPFQRTHLKGLQVVPEVEKEDAYEDRAQSESSLDLIPGLIRTGSATDLADVAERLERMSPTYRAQAEARIDKTRKSMGLK